MTRVRWVRRLAGGLPWAVFLLAVGGCHEGAWDFLKKKELPPEPAPPPQSAAARDPILRGTIGSLSMLANIEGLPVRGFGLVIGLGENGSGDCPTFVREYLVDVMEKEAQNWASLEDRRKFSAGQLIDSPSTAVVVVDGFVPPGIARHARFDILISAIPGTATRSLSGGLLLPCELRLAAATGNDEELLGGAVVARAGGPVFVNQWDSAGEALPTVDPRAGFIIGGGHSLEPRPVRLLLREPSFPLAQKLRERINERFGAHPKVADATSRGILEVTVPQEYAAHRSDFLQVLPHLYADAQPDLLDARLRDLARSAVLPEANLERIALVWEATGRVALPYMQPLYAHAEARVRYAAARAGLRLNDVTALPVVSEAAASADVSVALPAIRELGLYRNPQALLALQPLLDSRNDDVRIAAYEALIQQPQIVIRSEHFPHVLDRMQLNAVLDIVPSAGPPLIYVARSRAPRLAVFGADVPVTTPIFHAAPDDSVTLNALAEGAEISVFRKQRGRVSEPLTIPPRVCDLISALADVPKPDNAGRVRGLGLTYSQVTELIEALCRDRYIPARLAVEKLGLDKLRGPEPAPERPESDELAGTGSPAESVPLLPESEPAPPSATVPPRPE